MKLKNIVVVASAVLTLSSCSDLFEPAIENKQDLSQMFKDKEFARGILGSAYLQLPYNSTSVSDVATDDAVSNDNANNYMKMATGAWASNSDPMSQWQGRYNAIQYCNLMLENVDQVEWATGDDVLNQLYVDHFKGNAYAMRALQFFYLLRAHAGVSASGELLGAPIHIASEDGGSNFNVARDGFSACIDQIFSDLDEAEKLLPFTYGNVSQGDAVLAKYGCNNGQYNRAFGDHERGKIDGKIIGAIRAQVALWASSPAYAQFPSDSAAIFAGELLVKIGGISKMEQKGWTWYCNVDEIKGLSTGTNTNEIIWRDNLDDKNYTIEADNYPPYLEGKGRINPSQNLVDAFPMANGYPITDPASGYDSKKPYEGRDPRLAAYILCNGATTGIQYADYVLHTGLNSETIDGINKENGYSTRTGYYLHKLMRDDISLKSGQETGQRKYNARIRATEIFLDYAEAANEAGGPDAKYGKDVLFSAKDVIRELRKRAGVGGDKDPYLEKCASSKESMRELIRNERRLELCFENQRFYDLRRWNVDLSKLNETVKGIEISAENADGSIVYNIKDVETRAYKDYMIYGPIPYGETMKWSNLEQNKGW